MLHRSALLRLARPAHPSRLSPLGSHCTRRTLLTIGIETSCDDTSVAVLETKPQPGEVGRAWRHDTAAVLHYHDKVTANNVVYKGIHPMYSLESHQENLATLVQAAVEQLPEDVESNSVTIRTRSGKTVRRPDFISVTRGPGMRTSLFTGLDTAKGLAVAWQVPLVGVHHMAAHALTPRLVSATSKPGASDPEPRFPFLSLLISGGHSLVIHSRSLTEHKILASTLDTAIGDCLDKIARAVVPERLVEEWGDTMYGRLLERFAFPNGASDYNYIAPKTRSEELEKRPTKWGWNFTPPLAESPSALDMSFAGLLTRAERLVSFNWDHDRQKLGKTLRAADHVSEEERRTMAQEAMRIAFEHLASRIVLALESIEAEDPEEARKIRTVVVSGGVASNNFLRHLLPSYITARGLPSLSLVYPPVDLCTDNAAMIAWAGAEMMAAGYETSLTCRALRKWSLEELLNPPERG